MNARTSIASILLIASFRAGSALAGDMTAEQNATSSWMIEREKAWVDMACGGKWIADELFADDFKGTAPRGSRYGKPAGEPAHDPDTKWSKDCSLDEADVRFFGPDAAVVYGAESKTASLPDGKQERRCLAWTDTWLRRKGKWQIIAVQDNRIDCPPK